MKCVAIVQARTSSTRLPGKVLKPLCGVAMIEFMLRRLAGAARLDSVIVATSTDKSDDVLAALVVDAGFSCFRGDLNDVLLRFHEAMISHQADVIVRLTGDCPLVDSDIVDAAVATLLSEDLDYVSNVDPPTYPNGLDVEAMTMRALHRTHLEAKTSSDREHVTPYIRRHKQLFRQKNLKSSIDFSALRWTVDHPDDLALVSALAEKAAQYAIGRRADRFDHLRAMENVDCRLLANDHSRYERFAEE